MKKLQGFDITKCGDAVLKTLGKVSYTGEWRMNGEVKVYAIVLHATQTSRWTTVALR